MSRYVYSAVDTVSEILSQDIIEIEPIMDTSENKETYQVKESFILLRINKCVDKALCLFCFLFFILSSKSSWLIEKSNPVFAHNLDVK